MIAVSAGVVLLAAQEVQAQPEAAPALSPSELLTSAYALGEQASAVNRCYLLVRLAIAGAQLKDPRVSTWVSDLFSETGKLPESWNRTAMQKTALVALASLNPAEALRRLPEIPFTRMKAGEPPPEDLRADAAKQIFPVFWRHSKDLSALEPVADAIGESGQYPFLAMAPILIETARDNPIEASRLFGSALTYYRKGDPTRFTTADFVEFLLQTQPAVPPALLGDAIRNAVDRLTDDSLDLFGKESFQATLASKTGAAAVSSRRDLLLLRLMPLVRKLDPDWAKRLIEKHSSLRQDPGSDVREQSSTVLGESSPSDLAAMHARNFQRERVSRIGSLLPDSPDEAVAELIGITDPALRAEALGNLISGLSSSKPELAKSFQQELDNLLRAQSDSPRTRLLLHVALAKAAAGRNDLATFAKELPKVLDLGAELLRQDSDARPGAALPELEGFVPICDLAQVGGKVAPEDTVAALANVSNSGLRANALVSAALGLSTRPPDTPIDGGSPPKR